MLKGWKTYIVVIVGVLVNGAFAMGYIPEAMLPIINTVLGFLGIAALRSGIASTGK